MLRRGATGLRGGTGTGKSGARQIGSTASGKEPEHWCGYEPAVSIRRRDAGAVCQRVVEVALVYLRIALAPARDRGAPA
jgi:hypothetical protein